MKNTNEGELLLIKLQAANLLKVTLLYGCFSRFLNYTNGTKSQKTSQISLTSKYLKTSSKTFQNLLKFSAREIPNRQLQKFTSVISIFIFDAKQKYEK